MTDHCDLQMTPKPKVPVKALKKKANLAKDLKLNITSSPQLSGATIYSPVTDLTMNMCELSTSNKLCYGETPKRRLSMASNESTPTALQPIVLDMQMSQEAEHHQSVIPSQSSPDVTDDVDSPSELGVIQGNRIESQSRMDGQKTTDEDRSPLEMLESKSSAFRRFQAMPLPFCGFDQSPQASPLAASLAEVTSPGVACRFSLDEEDDENSQDSGVGFEKLTCQSPAAAANRLRASENTPERRSFVFDGGDGGGAAKEASQQDAGVYFEKERVAPLCSRRRGLFLSPSAVAAAGLRLLAHKSHSFDVRPRPPTLKRAEPDACGAGGGSGGGGGEGGTPLTPGHAAKRRCASLVEPNASPRKACRLQRCQSEVMVKSAMNRADAQPDLIGDFSRPYCLPLVASKHSDLKAIDSHTLAQLMRGECSDVDRFVIVDCRYPYEFDGGHIEGALNLYTKDGIMDALISGATYWQGEARKPTVLVFHCEFSSERGPKLSRFLRNKDRDAHNDCYPSLHYPEVYLLEGGYKAFFSHHQELCQPQAYLPMLHADHNSDLRHFRAKSKSWTGDRVTRASFRTGLRF